MAATHKRRQDITFKIEFKMVFATDRKARVDERD